MTTGTSDIDRASAAQIIVPTETALGQIKRLVAQEGLTDQAVRVGIADRTPAGFSYQLEFCDQSAKTDHDTALAYGEVLFLIDAGSIEDLRGSTLDYVDTGFSAGFKFDNPNKPKLMQDPVAVRVHAVITERINPGVASHGGYVTLLDVRDGTAFVKLGGGCQGCGHADTTVKQGIETMIREAVPEVHTVLDVTDHAAGENPYYQG